MKRPRPDPAAIERAKQHASAARVAAGLPAEDPDDAVYRELQEQRRRKHGRQKRA